MKMNTQTDAGEYDRDMQRERADLEEALAHAYRGQASLEDCRLLAWACGIDMNTVIRQEASND